MQRRRERRWDAFENDLSMSYAPRSLCVCDPGMVECTFWRVLMQRLRLCLVPGGRMNTLKACC